MFHRLGDHISINTTKQDVPLEPTSKPAGNNIKFPSHLRLWMGKKSDEKNEDAQKRKAYEINPIIA